jgi:predicted transcriptional regulator
MPRTDRRAPLRRGAGELEAEVMAVLQAAGQPLSPGAVQRRLAGGPSGRQLAYTTVVTILSRLHAKKALDRRRDGRAFRYAPVADEAGLAARRLAAMLDKEPDRQAVLSRFVADLSESDEALLRRVLADDDSRGA